MTPGEQTAALKAFARALLEGWPEVMGCDGFELQDLAVQHGLLVGRTVTERCGDICSCADYNGDDEMAHGVTCYRRAPWLKDESTALPEGVKA